jgi:hypothetical protein
MQHFSLSTCSKAASMKLQNAQVSIMHHAQFPYLLPWENNPVKTLGRLKPPRSSKTEKHKQ